MQRTEHVLIDYSCCRALVGSGLLVATVLGSQKLCVDILLYFPSVSLTPTLFRGHSIHLVKRIHV